MAGASVITWADDLDAEQLHALLVNVDQARDQMHRGADLGLAAVLSQLGYGFDVAALRRAVDPSADYQTRRGQARDVVAGQTDPTLAGQWRDTVRDSHTAALLGGAAAAAHLVSGGQTPITPGAPPVPDGFDPDGWVLEQQGGMGGDLARVLRDSNPREPTDHDLLALLIAGAGAHFYLDRQLSRTWLFGTRSLYAVADVAWVNWNTMRDASVCPDCAAAEDGSPYRLDAIPGVTHARCRCWITPTHGPT